MKSKALLFAKRIHLPLSERRRKADARDGGLWTRPFTLMFVAAFLMHTGLEMVNTMVGKYVHSFGASAVVVGVVTGSFAVTAIVARLFLGPAMDSFNKRRILYLCLLAQGVSFVVLGLASNVAVIFAARLIGGIGMAAGPACCLAMASESLPPSKFGTGVFVFSLSAAISQMIAPSVALFVVARFGYAINFFFATSLELFSALFASRMPQYSRVRHPYEIKLKNVVAPECLPAALVLFLLKIAYFCIPAFLLIYAESVGVVEGMGLYFLVYAGSMVLIRPLAGKLSDRFGLFYVIVPSIVCFGLSFLMISKSCTLPLFLASAVLSSFGYANSQPALQTLAMKAVPPSRRGSAISTCYTFQDLGNLVGPVIGGTAIELFGYANMWVVMIVPIAIALVLAVVFGPYFSKIQSDFEKSCEEVLGESTG